MLNQELSGGANSDPKPAVRTIVLSSGSQRRPHEVLFELTLRIHMPKKADQHTAQATRRGKRRYLQSGAVSTDSCVGAAAFRNSSSLPVRSQANASA